MAAFLTAFSDEALELTELSIDIRLFGMFRILSQNGQDVTPRSKKAIGLIALLVAGEGYRRNRRWLEDKLWSSRGPRQARGSLRQVLLDIRTTLGPARDILQSDRTHVWLRAENVTTDLLTPAPGQEFLEGLDVGDNEFEDWLVQQRVHEIPHATRAAPAPRKDDIIRIQCGPALHSAAAPNAVARSVEDQIGKFLTEFVSDAHLTVAGHGTVLPDLLVQSSVHEAETGSSVHVQIIDPASDRLVHSVHTGFDSPKQFLESPDQFAQFCWNAADWTLERLPQIVGRETPLGHRSEVVQSAFRETLSFNGARMRAALDHARAAQEERADGVYLAVQAWIMMSMILEEFLPEDRTNLDEIRDLILRAERASPHCPMVNAISATLKVTLFEEFDAAYVAARRSLKANPSNFFAMQTLAACSVRLGNLDKAYATSRRCSQMARGSKFEAMSAIYHVLICLQSTREEEAFELTRYAADIAPDYRAAQRTLVGLLGQRGALSEANARLQKLGALEQGFTLDRFFNDPDYPVHTLRRTGVLAQAQMRLM